jgi:hypothetical protein
VLASDCSAESRPLHAGMFSPGCAIKAPRAVMCRWLRPACSVAGVLWLARPAAAFAVDIFVRLELPNLHVSNAHICCPWESLAAVEQCTSSKNCPENLWAIAGNVLMKHWEEILLQKQSLAPLQTVTH